MAEYVEKWGDDVESAVELALKDLKLTRDEVVVTVLEQPSRGFLGLFGSKLAKVRVEKKSSELKELVKSAAEKTAKNDKETVRTRREEKTESRIERRSESPAANVKPAAEKQKANEPAEPAAAVEEKPRQSSGKEGREGGKKRHRSSQMYTKFTITAEDTDAVEASDSPAADFIREIAQNMGLNIQVKGHIREGVLYISLEGKDVGSMIGKRGQTLDAVQYLASIVQNKNSETHCRVIINAEKYREKREKTLQMLARRLADKCIKSGKSVRLEPMNPYERKVIHSTLQSNPKVTTRSEGTEPNRRVVIELKR